MKAFREERNTMHTKRAVRWLSSVAAIAAATLGSTVPLATAASAAGSESISAVGQQARYPVGQTAVITVSVTNPVAGDALVLSVVSGPDHAAPSASCTTISASGATCSLTNTGGAGTDQVVVTDPTQNVSSAPTAISFETMVATADQNVTPAGTPTYLYGAGEKATINVTFTGASTTPALKGLVTAGPDNGTLIQCTQSQTQPANWACPLTNGGTAGTDTVQLFDDDSANGTPNQADTDEAKTTITISFEGMTSTPLLPRSNTSPAGSAAFDVELTGRLATWQPHLREVIVGGQFSSPGTCTDNDAGKNPDPMTSWTCSVVNNGRADSATVEVYDDLDQNKAPSSTEPSATATANFEVLTAQDAGGPNHSAGSTATITVTAAGVPSGQTANIDYVITPAGDPDHTTTSVICPQTGSTFTCTLKNNGTGGTDHLTIFDDANNNGVYDGNNPTNPLPEPMTTLNVTFGDSVTATPTATTFPTKDSANSGSGIGRINVTVTSGSAQTPNVRYKVTASTGSDLDGANVSHACTSSGGTTSWVCDVANSGTAGTDTVLIYNDPSGTVTDPTTLPASQKATVTITFANPSSVTLAPDLSPGQGQAQIATGGCQAYTVTVAPGVQYPVAIVATQGLGTAASAPAASLSTCAVPGGSTESSTNSVKSSGGLPPLTNPTWTDTLTINSTSAQDPAHPGQIIVGISGKTAGTVNVFAQTTLATSANNKVSSNQTLTVVTPGPAHTVTVTPANPTIAQGGTATFTVLVQDANGTPLPGAAVSYVVASGGPDATSKAVACQAADQFGQAKCSLINNQNVGVDHVTFFSPLAANETAPATNDPQTTTTVTVQALPPAGSTLTFGCPDELTSDANQIVPACTVTTGSGGVQSIIFAAHVADASNAALANIPVTFVMSGSPSGSTTTATQVNTNAKGNALFVVSVPSPAAGNKVTVQASVGDPTKGGLGPDTAVATFQAPHPAAVGVTPASQKVAPGGEVSLTGRVVDQFGVGVSGQTLQWAVSGRNSQSGTATTGSAGTASFNYLDTGSSGSDTVTVLDASTNAPSGVGSHNPATAVVTFGSGGSGCTSNCGGSSTKEKPALTVSQKRAAHHREKLTLTVTSHPKLVAAKVVFYQLSKSGARHKIGTGVTGPKGKVKGTLKAAKGLHLRFQAKVKGRAGVRSGYSNVVKVHVK
ncbi:MAG TPA: hypothetical protein VHC43_02960 [Mycobacteriales bacterium]|nr:hypothetical protein [Mycobacteriales bacterium]